MRRRILKRLMAGAGVTLLLGGAVATWAGAREVGVTVTEVTKKAVMEELRLTADIAPEEQVMVLPKVSGRIEEIKVELGDRVEKGDLLAVVEDDEIALQALQAEAAYQQAKANYDKAESLSRIQAETNYYKALVGLNSAETQLKLTTATAKTSFLSRLAQGQAAVNSTQAQLDKALNGARPEELRQVEAGYQQALANYETRKRDLERARDDHLRGAISDTQYDAMELQFKVAEAQLAQAEATLELTRAGARDEDIASLRAQVAQAEAQLRHLEGLQDSKSWEVEINGANAQYENAKAGFVLAETSWEDELWKKDLQLAEAQMKTAEAQLKLARIRLDDTKIYAPINGFVSQRMVDPGALIGPSQPVVSVVNIDTLKIILHVVEEDLARVRQTKEVVVTVEDYLEETYPVGDINVSPVMDQRSRKVQVQLEIANMTPLLLPGMFPQVRLILARIPEAVVVPSEAVIERNGQTVVFVVEDSTARLQPVQIGWRNEGITQILSGVGVGQTVVKSGQNALKDGDQVVAKSE